MNKLPFIASTLIGTFLLNLQSCGSDAIADNPCPPSVNAVKISLINSITEQVITTANVVILGESYEMGEDLGIVETTLIYNVEQQNYQLPHEDFEIMKNEITIYSIDNNHHYNASKFNSRATECTNLSTTIYLCPNGTACR